MITLTARFRESEYTKTVTIDTHAIPPIDWESQSIRIERHLKTHDIHDYFVFTKAALTTYYFKTERERMLAWAVIFPDQRSKFQFVEAVNLTDGQRKDMAQKFQRAFLEKGLLKESFDIVSHDGDTNLYAIANSGDDLVTLMRWSDQLKAAIGQP